MPDELNLECEFALLGRLQRDYILPLNNRPMLDVAGGNLMYAAVGLSLWGGKAGLVARVSSDYPMNWLEKLASQGFDLGGIKQVPETFDMRYFVAYSDPQIVHYDSPINHFARRGLELPHALLAYKSEVGKPCSKSGYAPQSIHISDVPAAYRDVKAAHICPIDFISHKTLPSILKGGTVQTLSMTACGGYMDPLFWEEIPILLSDLTAFMTAEDEVKCLFQGRSVDLWEMANQLAHYGPEYIIIHLRDGSQLLYDGVSRKRWKVPAYPVKMVDPTGATDAFAGAFLAVYQQTYEPIKAVLAGNIAVSFVSEGSGPFFAMGAMPGLKEARLESLKAKISEI